MLIILSLCSSVTFYLVAGIFQLDFESIGLAI